MNHSGQSPPECECNKKVSGIGNSADTAEVLRVEQSDQCWILTALSLTRTM